MLTSFFLGHPRDAEKKLSVECHFDNVVYVKTYQRAQKYGCKDYQRQGRVLHDSQSCFTENRQENKLSCPPIAPRSLPAQERRNVALNSQQKILMAHRNNTLDFTKPESVSPAQNIKRVLKPFQMRRYALLSARVEASCVEVKCNRVWAVFLLSIFA